MKLEILVVIGRRISFINAFHEASYHIRIRRRPVVKSKRILAIGKVVETKGIGSRRGIIFAFTIHTSPSSKGTIVVSEAKIMQVQPKCLVQFFSVECVWLKIHIETEVWDDVA